MEVGVTVEKYAAYSADHANNVKSNSKLLKNETIHEYNKNSKLIHRESEGKLLISNRDFCVFWTQIQLQDESVVNISFSVVDSRIPEGDAVRAELFYQIAHAKPLSDTE